MLGTAVSCSAAILRCDEDAIAAAAYASAVKQLGASERRVHVSLV